MAARSLKIANHLGADTITFSRFYLQDPYPEFQTPNLGISENQMRTNAVNRGNRVFSGGGGINANHWDCDFTIHAVSNADFATLLGWASARPPVCLFSIDGGSNRYWVIIREFEKIGYRNNEDPNNANPFFSSVRMKVSVCASTSTAFGE